MICQAFLIIIKLKKKKKTQGQCFYSIRHVYNCFVSAHVNIVTTKTISEFQKYFLNQILIIRKDQNLQISQSTNIISTSPQNLQV